VEGETESDPVRRLRMQMKKNLLATLAFSQGVPMISHGDEIGRTQGGNNNAYSQDNETAWVDWTETEEKRELRRFAERVFALRRANPVFRRRRFFAGDPITHHGVKDIAWLRPDGREMTDEDWNNASNHVLGMLVHGDASDELDERGRPNRGETLLLMLNGGERPRYFELPALPEPGTWVELVNTARPEAGPVQSSGVNLVGHSLLLLGYEAPR
jgi:isoamylase